MRQMFENSFLCHVPAGVSIFECSFFSIKKNIKNFNEPSYHSLITTRSNRTKNTTSLALCCCYLLSFFVKKKGRTADSVYSRLNY